MAYIKIFVTFLYFNILNVLFAFALADQRQEGNSPFQYREMFWTEM